MMRIKLLFIGLFFSLGCVPILIGGGLLTGYALSNNSASGKVNIGYHDLWINCLDKLEAQRIEIIEAKESNGIIKAQMSDVNITVRINSLSSGTQELKVSARKYLLPKPHIAQDIFFKIVKGLK